MASAAIEPRSIVSPLLGFDGGINIRDAISQLAPNELVRAENCILDERGGASKRLGCTSKGTFGAGSDRILSMYTFYRGDTAPQVLIHTNAGSLYYTNDPGAVAVVWTLVTAGLSTTARMSFETFGSKCYMSNGIDSYASWDGTTYTTFPAAPKGLNLRLWKDTMWMSGITGLDDRVYSSSAGNAESWPGAGWIDIAKGDGDKQKALGTDGTYLIVFKRDRHFVIYDPVTFANRVVDYEKGCESHFSVVPFESKIYFLSRRGICQFLGDSPSILISNKVDPMFDPAVINLNALSNIYSYTFENRIAWAIPEAGQAVASIQLEYYPRLAQQGEAGPWMIHRIPCSTFTRVRSGTTEYLYGGHKSSNKFLWVFAPIGQDDGASFTGLVQTSFFDFRAPNLTKYIRRLVMLLRGVLTLQIKRDFDSAVYKTFIASAPAGVDLWSLAHIWGADNWADTSTYRELVVNTDAYGRYFSFIFTDTSPDTGTKSLKLGSVDYSLTAGEWAVYGIVSEASILGVRR